MFVNPFAALMDSDESSDDEGPINNAISPSLKSDDSQSSDSDSRFSTRAPPSPRGNDEEMKKLRKKIKNLNSMLDRSRFKVESSRQENKKLQDKFEESQKNLKVLENKVVSQDRLIGDLEHQVQRLQLVTRDSSAVDRVKKSDTAKSSVKLIIQKREADARIQKSIVERTKNAYIIQQQQRKAREKTRNEKLEVMKAKLAETEASEEEARKLIEKATENQQQDANLIAQLQQQKEEIRMQLKAQEEKFAQEDMEEKEKNQRQLEKIQSELDTLKQEKELLIARMEENDKAFRKVEASYRVQISDTNKQLENNEQRIVHLQEEAHTASQRCTKAERQLNYQADEIENLHAALHLAKVCPTSIFEGWLYKLPTTWRGGTDANKKAHNWKRRYFIINGNVVGYYESQDRAMASKALGELRLTKHSVVGHVELKNLEFFFGFCIIGSTNDKKLILAADTRRERSLWMEALARTKVVQLVAQVDLSKEQKVIIKPLYKGRMLKYNKSCKSKVEKYFSLYDEGILKWNNNERTYEQYSNSATVVNVIEGENASNYMKKKHSINILPEEQDRFFIVETTGKTLKMFANNVQDKQKWSTALQKSIGDTVVTSNRTMTKHDDRTTY